MSSTLYIYYYLLIKTITKTKMIMTICLVMVFKCLLVRFFTTKCKLPKFFLKRTNFILISKFMLLKVIQLVLQLLLGWNLTVRDVSATELRDNSMQLSGGIVPSEIWQVVPSDE
jgi:hypothetical protein